MIDDSVAAPGAWGTSTRRFVHQWTHAQIEAGTKIRSALADAVKAIVAGAPPDPDRSAAIRKVREARMDANSAITHGGKY